MIWMLHMFYSFSYIFLSWLMLSDDLHFVCIAGCKLSLLPYWPQKLPSSPSPSSWRCQSEAAKGPDSAKCKTLMQQNFKLSALMLFGICSSLLSLGFHAHRVALIYIFFIFIRDIFWHSSSFAVLMTQHQSNPWIAQTHRGLEAKAL